MVGAGGVAHRDVAPVRRAAGLQHRDSMPGAIAVLAVLALEHDGLVGCPLEMDRTMDDQPLGGGKPQGGAGNEVELEARGHHQRPSHLPAAGRDAQRVAFPVAPQEGVGSQRFVERRGRDRVAEQGGGGGLRRHPPPRVPAGHAHDHPQR